MTKPLVQDPAHFDLRSVDLKKPHRTSIRPRLEGGVCAFAMLIALGLSMWFTYVRASEAVLGEIRGGVLRLASSIALTIDGDTHRLFKSPSQRNTSVFRQMAGKLEELRLASVHVRYLYTNILENGKVFFIVDDSPQKDLDGDGKIDPPPDIMSPYSDASPGLIKALTEQVAIVDDQPYTDRWGTFISAYAPFFDSGRRFVGTIGLDLELSGLDERLQPLKHALKRMAIVSILFAILFGVSVWFMRRHVMELSDRRDEMIKDVEWAVQLAKDGDRREQALLSILSKIPGGFASPYAQEIPQKRVETGHFQPFPKVITQLDTILDVQSSPGDGSRDQGDKFRERFCRAAIGAYLTVAGSEPMVNSVNVEIRVWLTGIGRELASRFSVPEGFVQVSVDDELPAQLCFDPEELGAVILIIARSIQLREAGPFTIVMSPVQEEINKIELKFEFCRSGIPVFSSFPALVDEIVREWGESFASPTSADQVVQSRPLIPSFDLAVVRRWLVRCGGGIVCDGTNEEMGSGFCLTIQKAVEEISTS